MPFDTAIAYGIALLIAVVLGFMGVRNQRSEWRRERSDTVLDIMMAWAEAKAGILTTVRLVQHPDRLAPLAMRPAAGWQRYISPCPLRLKPTMRSQL